ncbi:Ig-like domain-containing protein [Duganella sp. FT27W]|uniref:Ig-like domain-containing protein n=1 Tax=Duganella sp. FT27W TaxID=2654636 RepID=UPI00186BAA58|nr:Ig-like domain-containing protein [Duganella sp. FT27W]
MTRYDDRSPALPSTAAPARTTTTRLRPTRSLLALETRIVFDGAAPAAALADPHDAAAGLMHKAIAGQAVEAARAPAPAPAAVVAPAGERAPLPAVAPDRAATEPVAGDAAPVTTIVFIDASVANPSSLLAGLKPGTEVVMLDKNSDGVQQIADALKGRHGLDSIQIISEGNSGRVLLGSATLADSNIDTYKTALAEWGSALRTGGDILLFGCNVADTATGEHFVNRLAELTGADVAASTDATGAAALGGNWVLEKHTGAIEADRAISERAMADYDSLLLTGNGTADGTYDFAGTLGPADAVAAGYKSLWDKLLVSSNLIAGPGTNVRAGTSTAGGTVVADFRAENTTVMKSFTFQDFSISGFNSTGNGRAFDELRLVVKDTAGGTLLDVSIPNGTTLNVNKTPTTLSSIFNNGNEWSLANAFSVTVTASLTVSSNIGGYTGGNSTAIIFESMKMSNIVGTSAPANVAPVFVGTNTALPATQNGTAIDVKPVLHVSDSDSGQTLTWSTASGGAPSNGTLNFSGATGASGGADITPGGTITYTPNAGYAGTDTFTIQVSDGTSTTTRVVTVNVAPATAGTPDLADASDTGSSNTDNRTNAGSLTFSGTSGAGDSTSTVRVFLDTNNNGTYDAGEATATATVNNGAWTVSGVSTSGLVDGAYNAYAIITSATGAVAGSRSAGLAVTIDKTAPGAPTNPIIMAAASDSGSSNSDGRTNVTNPLIRISLAGTGAVAGDSLELLLGGNSFGTPVLATLSATNISNGYIDMTLVSGSLGADGTKVLTSRVTDIAGNVGTAGPSFTIVLDTTAPAAPPAPTLDPASDSGSSNSDRITSVTTPVINGTAESGSTVTLYDSDGTTVLGTAVATGGVWSITSSTLADGVHNLTVKAQDVAGNVSSASSALQITVATAGVAPTGLALAAASDSGVSNTDRLTNVTTPTITGTALAGSIVTLYDTDGTTVLGTATATGGTWSITTTVALAEGVHNLTAKAVDVVGNTSGASSVLAITIDTTVPGTPTTVPVLAPGSDSGSSNSDRVTSVTNPTVRVSLTGANAVAGEQAELLLAGNALGTPARTTLSALDIANGYVDITVTAGDLGVDGSKVLAARIIDAAGNVGTASGTLTITLDTTAPIAPAAPVLAAASDSGASNSDGITRITTPVVAGTAEAGSLVTLYDTDGTTVLGTAVATGGVWSITSSTLTNGAHSLTVKATDTAGNTSAASGALTITIDATAPSAPPAPVMAAASDSGASNSDGITRITTPVFSGTAEAGSLVTLYDTDGTTVLGTAVATGGVWSITSSTLANGAHSLTVKATDTAGNTSAASNALAITIDTTAPSAPPAPVLAAVSDSGASNSDGITRITTPVITGTAEAGSTILLYDTNGTTVLGSAVATGGVWSITTTTLTAGAHSLTVKAIDAAGNTSAASGALAITIDTTAPIAPAAPVLAAASDSGASNSDGITRITTPVVAGTAEAGSLVTLYDTDGTTVLGTAVATGGVWSITSSTLTNGAHSLTVKSTDNAGNTSAASGALTITIDTTAPSAPPAPVMAAASDSGASNSDGITRITTPVFSGTAEAGSLVTLYDTDGTTVLGTAVATGGVWSITSSTLAPGAHSLTIKATDIAGNTSAASGPLTITIDTTAPSAPPAPVLAPVSDSGASNSDGITRITTPVITGTAEAGSTVLLYDTNGTTVLGSAVATGGVWSITTTTLTAGAHSLTVKAIDAAGNTSAASGALAITIDTTVPIAPAAPVLAAASDSGASNSDGITRITTPVVAGTAEAGSLVTLYDTDGTTVLGTAVATGGVWSITSSTLTNGAHSLTVKSTDTAGNTSAASGALTITIDTTAPSAPPAPVMAAASDSGASNSDGITRITTPVFSGTAEAGSLVTLYDTDGTTVLGTAVATGGVWSITSSTLAPGAHSLTIKATDIAGNTSAASGPLTITIDTTAPSAPPAPVLAPVSDSGASNSDGITRITTPVITGTAEAGSTVLLYDTNGTTVLGSAVATGGVWSITTTTLTAGAHSLTVKAIDAAGNTSAASGALAITIDTTAPIAPAAPVLAAASDSGASNSDRVTNVTTPVFTGTAEAGSLVTLYDTDGTTVLGTTVATGGVWSITSSALGQGAHSLTIKATDTAGNTSAASGAVSITIDTTAPAAPAAPVLARASDSGASNTDGVTSVTTPTVSGTAEAGSLVTLYDTDGTTVLGTAVATGGVWSITSSTLSQGAHNLTIKATDIAGNTSAASGPLTITIDTTAPSAPPAPVLAAASDSGASNSDGITRITAPVITGTAEAGSLVTLYDTDGTTVLGTSVATGGVWSITSSTLAAGAHSLTIKATDIAGNTSAASGPLTIIIDTTAPTAPAVPVLSAASDSGASNADGVTRITTPTVSGTAEAGSTVTLYDTDGTTVLGTTVATGGVWSITSSALGQGAHSLSVKATDTAGNTSAASGAVSITIDTTAPAAPAAPVLAPASDSGASNSDGVTSVTTPVITGTAEAGSLVTLYDTDGTTVLGTAVATGGVWSITSSTLAQGAHSLTIKATDIAGNTSAASGPLTITIDTTAPTAPNAPVLSAGSDNGVSNSDSITGINRPTVNGRAEAGSTVTLYDTDGVTVLGTTTADVNGDWRITSSLLADGVHSLSVKATDASGNTSGASAPLAVTIDTAAPAAPATPVLAPASDSGASNSDSLTSVTRPTITGRAEAGSTVTLYDTDGVTVLGTAVAATEGSWSITSSLLADGVHSLTVKATDTAGNTGSASPALNVTIDTAMPVTPAVPVLAPTSDSGASSSDGITSVTTPTITGRAQPGTTVTLFDTDGVSVLGSTVVGAGGTWSITSRVLADGNHQLTTRTTSITGIVSNASAALTVSIDTAAPAAPATPVLTPASDSGASNADSITSVTRPTITGRAEAGSTVTLYDTDGITVLGTAVAGANGNWSITSSTLADGVHSLSVKASDAAGNTSGASAPLAITIDTVAPATPATPVLAPASDSGASNSDGVTSVTRPTITGRAEAGSTVTLYDTDGVTVLGTTVVGANGNWSITSSLLADGVHSLTIKATDTAGNTSAASPALAITIDTAVPGTPAVPVLAPASDNGASNSDGITSVTTPTITGRAQPGTTVTLYDTDGVSVLGSTVVGAGGTWSITSRALTDGNHQLTTRTTSTTGIVSNASAALTVTIDTAAPATPATPVLAPASDSGASNSDGITNVARPTITGRGEPGATAILYDTDGVTVLGRATVDASGAWSITSSLLADGTHRLTTRVVDAAGNASAASPALTVVVDATAPAAAGTPRLDDGNSTTTLVTTPQLSGVAEPNSTVVVSSDGVEAVRVVADANGNWTVTLQLSLGAHSITARAIDAAGNVGATSAPLALTVLAPTPPVATTVQVVTPVVPAATTAPQTTAPNTPPIRDAAAGITGTSPISAAVNQVSTTQLTSTSTSLTDSTAATTSTTAPVTGTAPVAAPATVTAPVAAPAPAPATTAAAPVVAATPAAAAQLASGAALVLNRDIGLVTVAVEAQQGLTYAIPRDTFVSANGVPPTLTATLADGSPLPAWVRFDAVTGTFSGVPPRGVTVSLDIVVTASDGAGNTAKAEFSLKGDSVVKDFKPPQAALHGKHLLQALGLHRAAAAVDDGGAAANTGATGDDGEGSEGGNAVLADANVDAEAATTQAGALSTQLSREAQRFLQEANATLRHLTRL